MSQRLQTTLNTWSRKSLCPQSTKWQITRGKSATKKSATIKSAMISQRRQSIKSVARKSVSTMCMITDNARTKSANIKSAIITLAARKYKVSGDKVRDEIKGNWQIQLHEDECCVSGTADFFPGEPILFQSSRFSIVDFPVQRLAQHSSRII